LAARLPTEKDINVFNSFDERDAVKHFLGKDLEQATSLFQENFLYYQEDLMWMGPIAFCFYVRAARKYLLSEDSDNDAEAVNTFCGLIEFRLKYDASEIAAAKAIICEGIRLILERFDRYGCAREIYGDVAKRYHALLSRLSSKST
jgi:hypothetical protein